MSKAALRAAENRTRRRYIRVPVPPTEKMLVEMASATFLHDGSLLEMERRFNGMLTALQRAKEKAK